MRCSPCLAGVRRVRPVQLSCPLLLWLVDPLETRVVTLRDWKHCWVGLLKGWRHSVNQAPFRSLIQERERVGWLTEADWWSSPPFRMIDSWRHLLGTWTQGL